mgnify:CR=1 FL=1
MRNLQLLLMVAKLVLTITAVQAQRATKAITTVMITVKSSKGPQSQSELDSLTNKAVQKALENYKKGEQERIKQRIAEALEKEKDYANLSAAERAKREFEDSKSAFE